LVKHQPAVEESVARDVGSGQSLLP
jgi:hypothetical protein